jgi:hypothetical protein
MAQLQLPNSVSSVQDLGSLILEVREYAKWYLQSSIKQQVRAGQIGEPPTVSSGAAQMVQAWSETEQLNQKSLDNLITTLETMKANAETLTITLAAPASGELRKTLVSWCRENIAPGILVTFKFNATLLGGMVVRYGSRVFDWSFRREILNQRAKFPEVLRRV